MDPQNGRRHSPSTNHSHTLSAEDKISQAEGAIKSLKRHTDKGTCPEIQEYRARAKIGADNDFKREIKSVNTQSKKPSVQSYTSISMKLTTQGQNQERKESTEL